MVDNSNDGNNSDDNDDTTTTKNSNSNSNDNNGNSNSNSSNSKLIIAIIVITVITEPGRHCGFRKKNPQYAIWGFDYKFTNYNFIGKNLEVQKKH